MPTVTPCGAAAEAAKVVFNRIWPNIPGYTNTTRLYSPVTLNQEWPTLGRLVFMVVCCVIGTIVNGFFVAAFFVEHSLKRIGNVYHTCVGLADMVLTSAVMPISAVVLLSGQWDILLVCRILQFLAESATYCYSMFFALVSAETFIRLYFYSRRFEPFGPVSVGTVSVSVSTFCFILGGVGTFFELDYDYCERLYEGNQIFRLTTSVLFHFIPAVLTIFFLIASAIRVRSMDHLDAQYKRSQQYLRDYASIHVNMIAFALYIIFWLPYLSVLYVVPNVADMHYYHCAWVGVGRSLLTSVMYSTLNGSFRRAFSHLFHYCCCKTSLHDHVYYYHHNRRCLEYSFQAPPRIRRRRRSLPRTDKDVVLNC